TKLADLRGSSASEKIERIELAAALDVDIFGEGENEPDPLMVQLAFGTKGVHYDLDKTNKKINWYTDPATGLKYHARTIHDMKDTHSLMESIYLDTVLELNYQSPAIMLALAYGSDYTINSDNTIDGDRKTVGDLMGNNADALLKGIYLDTALEIKYDSPAIMLALAYGNDYTISGTDITYTTRNTLGDLMGSGSTDLINGIEMQKIITNVSSDDAMMNYILFNMTHPDSNASEYHVRTLGDFMNGSSAIIDGMMDALTLEEALGEAATNGQLLSNFKDTKLSELHTQMEQLTIQQAIGDSVTKNWILKHLAGETLSTIGDKLETLSIQQVLDTGTSHPAEGQNPSIYHYEYFNLVSGKHLDHDAVYEYATDGAYEMPAVLVGSEYKAVYTEPVGDTIVWKLYGATNTEVESPLTGTWKYLL
ncbi:MAG: hypothetical protein J6A87_01350, partial [Clostridia bacterium]|nr:hypothetical protein [Clostridia bacterium]